MRYLVAMSAPQTRKAIATIVDAPPSFAQAKLLAAARYPDCRVVSVRAAPAGLRLDAERVEIDWDPRSRRFRPEGRHLGPGTGAHAAGPWEAEEAVFRVNGRIGAIIAALGAISGLEIGERPRT